MAPTLIKLQQIKEELEKLRFEWLCSGLGDHVDWDRHYHLGEQYRALGMQYEQLMSENTDTQLGNLLKEVNNRLTNAKGDYQHFLLVEKDAYRAKSAQTDMQFYETIKQLLEQEQ